MLAKCLHYIRIFFNREALKEYEDEVTQVYLDLLKEQGENERGGGGSNDHIISKENIILRSSLSRILGNEAEYMEEYKVDNLFRGDFYVPKAKLVIEINGQNHYFPYTSKFNQFTNFKHKILIKNNYNIMHIKSDKLEGLSKDPHRLDDLLSRTIETYTKK